MKALLVSLLFAISPLCPVLADSLCGNPLTTTRGDRSNVGRAAFTRENSPTATVETGVWHIVGPNGAGAWSGHSNEWVFGDGTTWAFEEVCVGDTASVYVDYIRQGIAGYEVYAGHLSFDGAGWYVSTPGYSRYDSPFNSNLTITAAGLETTTPVRLFKNDSNSYTWTLPHSVNELYGPPTIIVSNDGPLLGGSISVVVATTPSTGLAGLIDGFTTLIVSPQSSRAVAYIRNDGRGRWHTF